MIANSERAAKKACAQEKDVCRGIVRVNDKENAFGLGARVFGLGKRSSGLGAYLFSLGLGLGEPFSALANSFQPWQT
eukprot:4948449-Alexandrium_andersonii.AAC.1